MGNYALQIALATDTDRQAIYRLRHEVYAVELGQHPQNKAAKLSDPCDDHNLYLVARVNGQIAGFISITLPSGSYSLDKYLTRQEIPYPVTENLYEVRLLTVCRGRRGGLLAGLLLYAAFRIVEAQGGTQIIAMGRQDLKPLYQKAALRFFGTVIQSGAVTYELMGESVPALRQRLEQQPRLLARLRQTAHWLIPIPFTPTVSCRHGGGSIDAIGNRFEALERRYDVVAADVLDAWFPPAPRVLSILQEHLPWLLQASPPAAGSGLIQTIADVRGVSPERLALGAGSSSLIFLALCRWLSPQSHVLLPDPTYGEYAHVLEQVIGCRVDRLTLPAAEDYRLDLERLNTRLQQAASADDPYDLVILVNPNNPTGQFLARAELEAFLAAGPPQTQFWIDEAYLDYVGAEESLEHFAASSRNVFVCKSLSKCYSLSGIRCAYLCGPASAIEDLRRLTPPWNVSLPAQVAAVAALQEPAYYKSRYAETALLRGAFSADLRRIPGLIVFPSPANWVLCRLSPAGPSALAVAEYCRTQNVFLREAASISARFGTHTLRIAVKDAPQNRCIAAVVLKAVEASYNGIF